MIRSVFAAMPIDRRFGIGVAAACIPVMVLCAWLVIHEWRAYAAADDALDAFQGYRAGLLAMEKVSAERGPLNSVLGEDLPMPEARMASLRRARDESDIRIAELLTILQADRCPACVAEIARTVRTRDNLAAARANADRLMRLPLAQREERGLSSAVNQMVDVIPQFAPSINALAANVVDGDRGALNCLILATLTADLREYAGQLGSHFTAALAARRRLDERDRLAIERTEGRIDQLRALIDARVRDREKLDTQAFEQMNEVFFGKGMAYIAGVRRLASQSGGSGTSPAELADRYVPLMRPITAFRDQVLDLVETEVRHHRCNALVLLAVTGFAVILLIAALLAMVMFFRTRVVQPLVDATQVIGAIANGDLTAEIPTARYRDEVGAMFAAISVLKANTVERQQLEHERGRLIHELKAMAETDFLTHLLNRRAFENRARAICSEKNGVEPIFALIMLDIDHFKNINDRYGHAAGDLALQIVAGLCRETFRQSDIVARWGGEEFAMLSRVRDAAQAIAIADILRNKIAETRVHVDGGDGFTMTASFGIACASADSSRHVDRLIGRADSLLYKAKEAGRNRVVADTIGLSL
jgi:diguanylate cyclase (GGDEF)-like protein